MSMNQVNWVCIVKAMVFPVSPAFAGGFFITESTGMPMVLDIDPKIAPSPVELA